MVFPLILSASGCTAVRARAEPATDQVSATLSAALNDVEGFSALDVTRSKIILHGVASGQAVRRQLWPDLDTEPSFDRFAIVDSTDLDPDELQRQVTELAAVCPRGDYRIRVAAVTSSAHLTTVTCGDPGTAAVASLLNGRPLGDLSGPWTSASWQTLADELVMLSPAGQMNSISIRDGRISFTFSDADASGTCQPIPWQALDGQAATMLCWERGGSEEPMALADLTGPALYRAAQEAEERAGIAEGQGSWYLISSREGHPNLAASTESKFGEATIG
ncbi:MAG: hypothetical protein ACK5LS_06560 [Propioniciclava sp.]